MIDCPIDFGGRLATNKSVNSEVNSEHPSGHPHPLEAHTSGQPHSSSRSADKHSLMKWLNPLESVCCPDLRHYGVLTVDLPPKLGFV